MPDKIVNIPGVGKVKFPDSMTKAQINAASTRLYQQANPTAKQPPVKSWIDTAVDWLPTAGAVAGGVVGTAASAPTFGLTGIPQAALLSGVGGAAGEAAKQTINRLRGNEAPTTSGEAALTIGSEGLKDAATTAVLGGIGKAAQIPAVASRITAAGEGVQRAGASAQMKRLSEGGAILEGLINHDWRGALAAYSIPPLVRGAGRMIAAGGRALERKAAATAAESLADDVALVRESIGMKWAPDTALKIVANGDGHYYDVLKTALLDSLKTQGYPPPKAVADLLKTPTFARLPKP